MLSKPVPNDLYHGDNMYCFFAAQPFTLLKIQRTIQEAQEHRHKVEHTTVLDPVTDIWLSESQYAKAGMANLESEANLEVCGCKRKNEERKKKHKSGLK